MIVVLAEAMDVTFEIARQVIILEQDAVLERLVPSLDLALGLGMTRRCAHVVHASIFEPLCKVSGDVAGAVVAEQSWFVHDARRRVP